MGKVRIFFEGLNQASALSGLSARGVRLSDVVRKGKSCVFTVESASANAAVAYLREKCYNVRVERKLGLSAAADFARRRAAIVVFAILAVVLLYVASGFCLRIDVSGDLPADKVLAAVQQCGAGVGRRMRDIDADELENKLAVNLQVAYAVVNKRGSTLYVSTVASRQTVSPVDMHKRRDIVAERGGVVTKVVCLVGTPVVRVGDKVTKGDTLIAGVRQVDEQNSRDVYAVGHVEVQLSVTEKVAFDGTVTVYEDTDETYEACFAVLFGRQFGKACQFENYRRTDAVQYMPCGVQIVHSTFVRTVAVTRTADISQVAEELKRRAESTARAKADFVAVEVLYDVQSDGVTCTVLGLSVNE